MKIIVGLGNPGEKYKTTRHNVGFMALDFVLRNDRFLEAVPSHEFKSEMHTWQHNGKKIIFLKPLTYMNDSGQALKVICNFYKLDLSQDVLVIHDEVDLPFGTMRDTSSSSAAGHNGIKSIIENIGTQDFHRIRIGVESRASRTDLPTDVFVLQDFTEEEIKKLHETVFPEVKQKVEEFITAE